MGNDHVSKPNPSAFDEMHLLWKIFWVVFGLFMLVFWGSLALSLL